MKNLFRLLGVLMLGLGIAPALSSAGTYVVKDCQYAGSQYDHQKELAAFSTNAPGKWTNSGFTVLTSGYPTNCAYPQGNTPFEGLSMSANYNYGATANYVNGDSARFKWSLPNGLGFQRVKANYYTTVQNTDNPDLLPRMLLHNAGANGVSLPISINSIYGYLDYTLPSNGQRSDFEINLKCVMTTCQGANYTDQIRIGNIDFTVVDPNDPYAFHDPPGGPYGLFNPGTVSGSRIVNATSIDTGSGVYLNYLLVNNQFAAMSWESSGQAGVSCNAATPTYNSFQPCPIISDIGWFVDTTKAPFVNGANQVKVCAQDYSGNNYCEPATTVTVSN